MEVFGGNDKYVVAAWSRILEMVDTLAINLANRLKVGDLEMMDAIGRFEGFNAYEEFAVAIRRMAHLKRECRRVLEHTFEQPDEGGVGFYVRLSKMLAAPNRRELLDTLGSLPLLVANPAREENDELQSAIVAIEADLEAYRSKLLYCYSSGRAASPVAFDWGRKLVEALLADEELGLRFSPTELLGYLNELRFGNCHYNGSGVEISRLYQDGPDAQWPSRRPGGPSAADMVSRLPDGFVSIEHLRKWAELEPGAAFDKTLQTPFGYCVDPVKVPSLYLVLCNAPQESWFSMEAQGDALVPTGKALVRTQEAIQQLSLCAGVLPAEVEVVQAQQVDGLGCREFAGWFQVSWEI